ncbi:MAG: hypothetical protein M1825_000971 [Sarcosagium campestre]|nr:MAG: hypothetical protein M1825_000971 [Sarcosagium campestre]
MRLSAARIWALSILHHAAALDVVLHTMWSEEMTVAFGTIQQVCRNLAELHCCRGVPGLPASFDFLEHSRLEGGQMITVWSKRHSLDSDCSGVLTDRIVAVEEPLLLPLPTWPRIQFSGAVWMDTSSSPRRRPREWLRRRLPRLDERLLNIVEAAFLLIDPTGILRKRAKSGDQQPASMIESAYPDLILVNGTSYQRSGDELQYWDDHGQLLDLDYLSPET